MKKSAHAQRAFGALLALAAFAVWGSQAFASDWARFHGPDGSGVSADTRPLPVKWSETENLKWKCKLPGPGSSSPIVVGQRVFVTCWSGYGMDRDKVGEQKNLRRHLICLDRATGKVNWDASVEPVLPEDPYSGNFTEHGYASHTPVSDGQRVYAFFGKTGVLAFDLDGKKLWQTSVGTGSGTHNWGTASSPILYKNLVIVPATAESESLVALDKATGKEVWRQKDAGFSSTWGTPILVDCGKRRTDLVMAVPFKIWGCNPDDGKPRWQCEGVAADSICTSALAHDGVVYAMEMGPRGGGAMAVRGCGNGDVTKTNIVWRSNAGSRIVTPVFEDGRLYSVNARVAMCLDAATGKQLYRTKLTGEPAGAEPEPQRRPRPDGAGGGPRAGGQGRGPRPGGGPGRRGGRGGQDYASPVLANGNIYFLTRSGVTFVYAAGPVYKLIAQNSLAQDGGDFSGTPAISDGQLFIRSSKFVYCIAD